MIVYGTEAGECLRANLPLVVETLPCPIERSVVFGRNVWQSGDTRGMIRALGNVIHENRPATEAASVVENYL